MTWLLDASTHFVQPSASRTGNRLWRQNSANEPSVMQDLLHGTVYLIILTLPVLNDSSKLFCFLHAPIIELHSWPSVVRTAAVIDQYPAVPQESWFLLTHLHSTSSVGRSHQNIVVTFGVENLEWYGYPMVKKFWGIFIHFNRVHEHDRQMDWRTDTAWRHRPRLCIALCGKKKLSDTF